MKNNQPSVKFSSLKDKEVIRIFKLTRRGNAPESFLESARLPNDANFMMNYFKFMADTVKPIAIYGDVFEASNIDFNG